MTERNKLIIFLFFICIIIGLGLTNFDFEPWQVRQFLEKTFIFPVAQLVQQSILNPVFIGILGFTLLMERLYPANPNQKLFSLSFAQDLVWFVYETILHAVILTTYVYGLKHVFTHHLTFLTFESIGQWSYWGRFFWGILLTDFLFWLQHYINHIIPLFWEFHTVHHSQKELNFFTDFRYHIVEYVVRETILTIPLLMLGINIPNIILFSIFRKQYTHFYHGNIKTNLGPLKYILVTPQSHRVHHSKLKEHHDKNFGSLFSIWDFMFKTQYLKFDEYPETGIPDEEFPHEISAEISKLLWMPLKQMIYPFKRILKK